MDSQVSQSEVSGVSNENFRPAVRERVERQFGARAGAVAVRAEVEETPWWLWWNLLSLDAPTVAVAWALLFASAGGMRLRLTDAILLALSVWIIYVADRLLDGSTSKRKRFLQARHFFCARHRLQLACLLLLAIAVILWMAAQQSERLEVIAGMKLGAIVAVYLAAVHASSGWAERIFPKELAVGVLFAAGTTLPVWSVRGGSREFWGSFALFAALCSLNCLAIECWELNWKDERRHNAVHRLLRCCDSNIKQIAAVLAMISLAAFMAFLADGLIGAEVLAVALGSLLIWVVDERKKLSVPALRVLADATLLVAALTAPLFRI
jgi:hypothetical protein